MALIKCPECERDISANAGFCPHCGNPVRMSNESFESESWLTEESSYKNKIATVIGFILEVLALVVFFSFKNKYINNDVLFGGDFNSYTYQTLVYIATALRFGISGILIGIGALLQCSKTSAFQGKATTKRRQ